LQGGEKMGIRQEMESLKVELDNEDRKQIEAIVEQLNKDQPDEFLRNPTIEFLIEEYLTVNCPQVMDALRAERTRQSQELLKQAARRYDTKGDRLCDETGCGSTETVEKCHYCERYVCKGHNYGMDIWCCYACWKEHSNAGKS
jgi:hypothetical protein